jgi:hypothetical protein
MILDDFYAQRSSRYAIYLSLNLSTILCKFCIYSAPIIKKTDFICSRTLITTYLPNSCKTRQDA